MQVALPYEAFRNCVKKETPAKPETISRFQLVRFSCFPTTLVFDFNVSYSSMHREGASQTKHARKSQPLWKCITINSQIHRSRLHVAEGRLQWRGAPIDPGPSHLPNAFLRSPPPPLRSGCLPVLKGIVCLPVAAARYPGTPLGSQCQFRFNIFLLGGRPD